MSDAASQIEVTMQMMTTRTREPGWTRCFSNWLQGTTTRNFPTSPPCSTAYISLPCSPAPRRARLEIWEIRVASQLRLLETNATQLVFRSTKALTYLEFLRVYSWNANSREVVTWRDTPQYLPNRWHRSLSSQCWQMHSLALHLHRIVAAKKQKLIRFSLGLADNQPNASRFRGKGYMSACWCPTLVQFSIVFGMKRSQLTQCLWLGGTTRCTTRKPTSLRGFWCTSLPGEGKLMRP